MIPQCKGEQGKHVKEQWNLPVFNLAMGRREKKNPLWNVITSSGHLLGLQSEFLLPKNHRQEFNQK